MSNKIIKKLENKIERLTASIESDRTKRREAQEQLTRYYQERAKKNKVIDADGKTLHRDDIPVILTGCNISADDHAVERFRKITIQGSNVKITDTEPAPGDTGPVIYDGPPA